MSWRLELDVPATEAGRQEVHRPTSADWRWQSPRRTTPPPPAADGPSGRLAPLSLYACQHAPRQQPARAPAAAARRNRGGAPVIIVCRSASAERAARLPAHPFSCCAIGHRKPLQLHPRYLAQRFGSANINHHLFHVLLWIFNALSATHIRSQRQALHSSFGQHRTH